MLSNSWFYALWGRSAKRKNERNKEMKQDIIDGKLGIARIEGRYELVPQSIAEKIQQRNDKRVVLFEKDEDVIDENDPYAEFQVPDDLIW